MFGDASVVILEEPASNETRFRYSCERRKCGSLRGVNSTFPAIQVLNYTGTGYVVVSCVTKNKPYKQHPHDIIGKGSLDGNGNPLGVCCIHFTTNSESPAIIQFKGLGIQCTKRNEIAERMNNRKRLRIDPFKNGFEYDPKMDLNCVRLCFQVILKPDPMNDKMRVPLIPIVSQPITDKKILSELIIHDISDTTSSVNGGKKIMIFSNSVSKEDIRVRFFERDHKQTDIWEDWANFKHFHIHKKIGISLITPKYRLQDINDPVDVFIQLYRISDMQVSEPIPFQYIPDVNNIDFTMKRKRCKMEASEDRQHQMNNSSSFVSSGAYTQNVPTGIENIDPNYNSDAHPYANGDGNPLRNNHCNINGNAHGNVQPQYQYYYNLQQQQYLQQPTHQSQQCYQQSAELKTGMEFNIPTNSNHLQN